MKLTNRLKHSMGCIAFSTLLISGCISRQSCLNNGEPTNKNSALTNSVSKKNGLPVWLPADTSVTDRLGKNLTETLFYPDCVKCYYLVHKDGIKDKVMSPAKGYSRDTLLAELNEKQIGVLQYILIGNSKSYSSDSIKIEAPYLPILEFLFQKENQSPTSVIISTSDNSWTLISDEDEKFNFNYSDSRMVNRFCEYYLNKSKL